MAGTHIPAENNRPDTLDGRAGFIVAETAIPLGCSAEAGEAGLLILDPDNLDHRAILSAWNGDVHDGDQERRA